MLGEHDWSSGSPPDEEEEEAAVSLLW